MRISLFSLLLLMVLAWGCHETTSVTEEITNEPAVLQLELRSEQMTLGQVVDGRFRFTVSDEDLQRNYALATEGIYGETGDLASAYVELPGEDADQPYFVLDGMIGEDNSAFIRTPANLLEGGVITIGPGVLSMACSGCSACRYRPGDYCKCVAAPGNPCPKGWVAVDWDLPTD